MTIDHIVPLGHPEVVGLHVLANLQYLRRSANSTKGAKLPTGLTATEAVKRGLAIWRKDIGKNGTVDWEPYRPVS
jgi:hypothetical protein